MYKLDNNIEWTEELKNAFKTGTTRAKIIYDGNQEINETNMLKSLELKDTQYVPSLGFIGQACSKELTFSFVNSEGINLENKELTLKIGAEYNGDVYYITYGNFIVCEAPHNDKTNNVTSVVANDYMIKFDVPYEDTITYPCTLKELVQNICEAVGVELGSEEFSNSDFIVIDNQFEGSTAKEVIKNIAKSAFSWARIGQDNKLYFDLESGEEKEEEGTSFTLENPNYLQGGSIIKLTNENESTVVEGTSFEITDADVDKKHSIIELEGNTTQNGTPTPSSPVEIQTVSGDNEVVVRGKNLIPTNVNEWERGQYSASNGTKIDNVSRIRLKELLPIRPSATYKNGNYKGLIVRTYGREKNFLRNVAIVNTNATLTTTAEEYYLGITIDGTIDTYVENTTKVMLTYNNITSTEWEAYIGNSYRVDFGGKNKLDLSAFTTTTSNGITVTPITNNGVLEYLESSGTYSQQTYITLTNTLHLEPNTKYFLSGAYSASARLRLREYASGGSNLSEYFDSGSGISFTTKSNVSYVNVQIVFYAQNNVKFYPQLELGTVATEYSPYVENPLYFPEINGYKNKLKRAEGKNLLDLSAFTTTTSNGITVTPIKSNNNVNYLESSGTYSQQTYITLTNSLHLEPNKQYFLSGAYSASARLRLREYSSGGSNLSEYFDSGSGISFTTKSNVSYVNVQIVFYAQNSVKFYPMVTEGSTALPYEPYGNNWYIEKNIGKVVLNGSESWAINRSGTANWYYYANISSININTDSTSSNTLCDHYTWGSVGVSNTNTGYYIVKNNGQVRIRYGTEDTVANYKTWLGSNNVTLYYTLATPTYETITNENLIQQLNNIQDIELIENLCYVDWVGTEKPTMTLKYNQTIISGDNEVVVSNENLFDKNTDILENYTFGGNGEFNSASNYFLQKQYISVLPNTTYYFSRQPSNDSLRVCEYKKGFTFIKRNYEKYTITTSADTHYIRVSNMSATLNTLQIKTSAIGDYIAHKGNSYRIDFGGVNNFYIAEGTYNGVTVTRNSDGTYLLNGTATATSRITNTVAMGDIIGTVAGKISKTITSGTIRLRCRNSGGSLNYDLSMGTNTSANTWYRRTGTVAVNVNSTEFTIENGTVLDNVILYAGLYKGNYTVQALPRYSPYVSNPIELTENDTIQKVEGEWCVNETPIDNEYLTTQLDNLQTMALYEGINYIDWIGKFKATMLLKYFSDQDVTFEEITTHDYKVNSFKHADEYYGRLNRVGYADSDIEGQEEYVQNAEDIEENGLKDLFIYDNLFAYTEAKRQQLVLAAQKLLGFRYMPIQQIDLKGLIYLDCTDYLKITDADEDETILYSRCLNHTIKYQGYVADSIESLAQSETERTFENLNSPILANTRTQVIVDKANKKINLAVESVEETQEKVSELEISVDGISSTVNTLTDVSMDSESSTATVTFESVNASEPIGIKVHPLASPGIKCICPISSLYPSNTLYMTERVIRFERTYEEEGETKTENIDYQLPADLLYYDGTHYDEFELDYNNKICKIIKRCQYNSSGSIVPLSQEQEIEYDYPEIILLDGAYTINIMGYNVGYLYVKLMKQNPYTSQFTTQVQTRSEIQVTAEGISSEVATKVGENEIISKINQSAEQIQINADKISIEGKAVNFTTNIEKPYVFSRTDIDLLIEYLMGREQLSSEQIELYDVNGDGFVDTTDYVVIQKAITDNDGVINGTFSIDPYSTERSIILKQYDGAIKTYVGLNGIKSNNITGGTVNVDGSLYVGRTSNEDYTAVWATEDQISVRTPTSESVMTAYDVTTPEVIQTSREEDKKNFEKLSNGLDIILNTDIYKYHLKTQDDKDKKHIGFVIGDKFKHSREITSEKDNKEVGVDLYSMIAACYKAIQEQQNKIEELEKKIKEEK